MGGLPRGTAAPCHAVADLYVRTIEEAENSLKAIATEIALDGRNSAPGPSVVSEAVEQDENGESVRRRKS
jgi:hypothetical protein